MSEETTPYILHVFSTFGRGGAQVRTAAIINALGDRYRHAVISMDGRFECAELIAPGTAVELIEGWPGEGQTPGARALYRMLRDEAPDLLLTYNWGAMEAVAAGRLLGIPVVHAEDGFNPDEAHGQKFRRVMARRALLRSAAAVVVPSHQLQDIATRTWHVPSPVLQYIPNAVDCEHFRPGDGGSIRQQLGATAGEILIGTVGHLGGSKNVGLMIAAVGAQAEPERYRIVVIGDGPQRPELEALAAELGLSDRVVFAGDVSDPAAHLQALDVFTLTSRTEQMPLAVLEAMATALPIVATDVGDVARMVAPENAALIVPSDSLEGVAAGLRLLAGDRGLRQSIGQANLRICRARFDQRLMFRRYDELWAELGGGATADNRRRA
jgi:glycosyltransferase involved in cell wall biosynthesis